MSVAQIASLYDINEIKVVFIMLLRGIGKKRIMGKVLSYFR